MLKSFVVGFGNLLRSLLFFAGKVGGGHLCPAEPAGFSFCSVLPMS